MGSGDESVRELQEALAIAQALGHPPTIARAAASLAKVLALRGDDDGARVQADRAKAEVRRFAASLGQDRRAGFLAADPIAEILALN